MSYQQKYLKYKNKYLGLKSKYGHLLNTSETESSLPETSVPNNKLFNELDTESAKPMHLNARIVNSMYGGGNNVERVTETETTIQNTDNTEDVRKLFKQIAGAKPKKSSKKTRQVAKKHFFRDDSDLSESTNTSSLANDDSEFSSSELDW
jgi:hypothetical protein